MTESEALEKLAEIERDWSGDPEIAHGMADGVLLQMVPRSIAKEFERVSSVIGFWYA